MSFDGMILFVFEEKMIKKLMSVNKEKLAEVVKTGKTVIEFSAPWCPECRCLEPAWSYIEKDLAEYNFVSVDRDISGDLMKGMNIKGMPSFIVYENGIEKARLINGERYFDINYGF